ncbi:DNA-binding protein [Lysinibacillus sphaericus]|uniref:helix-turn-helix domain-containing protein n=1 Tax=Lysinibacillus sphaericus TaxID=1421 RepID=UPI0018CE2FAF|nr:XRE family transcriptional regulator [Lysinibacillus sphaericus]MBG9454125.1 DNA-binding protein [Lysinibacillus sphaericus]MBG9477438.1 DNA-binding protein [Lysinibacillus sphaericus]MBG9593620.1 DNA-binding protein [Lysinibacillus sphaericus]
MEEIHQIIKKTRIEQGMTLKNLSEKTNLSISFLSQIERGSSSLAITSLKKIADAFSVPITYFFESVSNNTYVVKEEDRKPFKLEGSSVEYTRLNGNFSGRNLEPLLVKLAPGQIEINQESIHPGEEFYYVLKGAVLFKVGGQEYFLREGETIHYPSEVPHSWENPLNEESVVLSVLTPVIF